MSETGVRSVAPLAEALQKALTLEVRSTPGDAEYFEAVLSRDALGSCCEILQGRLGPPMKDFGRPVKLQAPIKRFIDEKGGLWKEQCLFLARGTGTDVTYAALWPWRSEPDRLTLKLGVGMLDSIPDETQEGGSTMRMDRSAMGLLWLRMLIGVGIASHGYGKITGGMDGLIQGVAQMGFPLPGLFAWAAALSELVGGVCLAAGLFTPVAASAVFATMSVALFLRHGGDPFRVKELAFLYWAVAGACIMLGGGRYSLDRVLKGRR